MVVGGVIMVTITVVFGCGCCWAVVRVRALRRSMSMVVVIERLWVGGSILEVVWSMMISNIM